MTTSPLNFDATTKLKDLKIPHLDVVLAEIFHIPPLELWQPADGEYPKSVGDLAVHLPHQATESVLAKLREIIKDSQAAELNAEGFLQQPKGSFVILDVRDVGEDLPVQPVLQLSTYADDLERLLSELKNIAGSIVCVCDHGSKAFSVAMFLRSTGIDNVYFLNGGIAQLKTFL